MTDDLFLIESSGISHSHEPKWDNDGDYENLRRIVSLVECTESKILGDEKSRNIAKMRYGNYIIDHYLLERRRLASIGWRRGDEYPPQTCPYYIWRDAHMEVAWEFLRRSSNYRTYFSRYMRTLNKCFPQIAECVTKYFDRSENVSEYYRAFIENYRANRDIHDAWRLLSRSKEFKLYFEFLDDGDGEVWTNRRNIQISEQRIYDIFNLLPYFGVMHPDCSITPIFLRYTQPVKVVGTKRILQKEIYCLEENVFSTFEMGIILAFRLDGNIEDQLHDARKKIEHMCNSMGAGLRKDVDNEARPRLGKYEQYIRLMDAKKLGITSPNKIGPVLYKNSDAAEIVKNIEKAMQAAEGISMYGYYDIATVPFRK